MKASVIVVFLLLILSSTSLAKPGKSSLSALRPLVLELHKTIGKFIKGAPGIQSNTQFVVDKGMSPTHPFTINLWRRLRAANAVKPAQMRVDLRIFFVTKKGTSHKVQIAVAYLNKKLYITEMKYYTESWAPKSLLSKYKGKSEPLGIAARKLALKLNSKQCTQLPFLTAGAYSVKVLKKNRAKIEAWLKKQQKENTKICKQLSSIKWKKLGLTLDDIFVVTQNPSGKPVGSFRLHWKLNAKGKLVLYKPGFIQ